MRKIVKLLFVICLTLSLFGCQRNESVDLLLELELEYATVAEDGKEDTHRDGDVTNSSVFVYVCGAVVRPGVYELPSTSRVFEAIDLAGGITNDAVPEYINLARIVMDEERIYVPNYDDIKNNDHLGNQLLYENQNSSNQSQGKVNINQADLDGLMTLTGIGPSKAKSIIDYREQHGLFSQPEDIMNVSGIGLATFNKIKDEITH